MTISKKDPQSFNTGGGAYVGGNVNAGGDFVGRDKHTVVSGDGNVVNSTQGGSLEEFSTLLAQLREQLPQSGMDPEVAEAIDADCQVVEQQAEKPSPNGTLIKSRLGGMVETIKTAGGAADATTKILALLTKLSILAGTLFP
jgi:hypothetical protein